MKVELLCSVMFKDIHKCVETMKIASDAVIINQCDGEGYEEMDLPEGKVRFYSVLERGVGRSRNAAIAGAKGDICLFSDEDIVYDPGYADKIISEFEKNPEADIIFFNVRVCDERRTYYNTEPGKVTLMNCGKYSAYSLAIRKESMDRAGVLFSTEFGGGARYSNGEDSLFIRECIKRGLKARKSVVEIGEEIPRPSTWFKGYTDKFFYDRGVLFKYLYGKGAFIWSLQFVIRKKEMVKEMGRGRAFKLMLAGTKLVPMTFDAEGKCNE